MIATTKQMERTARDFSAMAKEPISAEQIKGIVYGFGSELGTLRIFAKYNTNGSYPNPRVRVGYSENMKTHYFSIELPSV